MHDFDEYFSSKVEVVQRQPEEIPEPIQENPPEVDF
jgi:hypothetical protein